VKHGLGESEAAQFSALKALAAKNVKIENWPPEIVNALKAAWTAEVTDMVAKDRVFADAWRSLTQFREEYDIWREIGLPPKSR